MSSNPEDVPAPDADIRHQQQESTSSPTATADPAAADPVATEPTDEEVAERQRAWMAEHGKTYADEAERERRLGIFHSNLRYIEAHNRGGHSYTLGLNQFADLTDDELRATHCGGFLLEPTAAEEVPPTSDDPNAVAPDKGKDEGSTKGDGQSPPPQPRRDL